MEVFLTLVLKLIPLYLIIILGFIAGKFLKVQKESLASLLIYIIAPVVIFHGVVTTQLTLGTLSLPFVYLFISCLICLLFFQISKKLWTDSTKNIMAFAAGSGNVGYFGLPVAVSIFGEKAIGIAALIILGSVLYESTLGFFITARGHHTVHESILKLIKLPAVYAFLFGVIFNLLKIPFGQIYFDTIQLFRGTYTILGMMVIGLGLASIKEFKFDLKFILTTFVSRFIVWPILIFTIIYLDGILFHLFPGEIHKVLTLMSVVPIAANTVAFATLLKAQPEKASLAVLSSTLFALFYIPLITNLFLR